MKPEVRTLGWDDAPRPRADGRVPVVGVKMRGGERVERLLATGAARDRPRRGLASAPSREGGAR